VSFQTYARHRVRGAVFNGVRTLRESLTQDARNYDQMAAVLDRMEFSLRERILVLAHWHLRYGAEMIYLQLRQAGLVANHKRVGRLYALIKL